MSYTETKLISGRKILVSLYMYNYKNYKYLRVNDYQEDLIYRNITKPTLTITKRGDGL